MGKKEQKYIAIQKEQIYKIYIEIHIPPLYDSIAAILAIYKLSYSNSVRIVRLFLGDIRASYSYYLSYPSCYAACW